MTGGQACTKYEFALSLAETFGLGKTLVKAVSVNSSLLHAPRPRDSSLQTEKIVRHLGTAMPDVQSGLRRFRTLHDTGFGGKLKQSAGE
jgi:dTDP-4-dehydrorhamnose reductase